MVRRLQNSHGYDVHLDTEPHNLAPISNLVLESMKSRCLPFDQYMFRHGDAVMLPASQAEITLCYGGENVGIVIRVYHLFPIRSIQRYAEIGDLFYEDPVKDGVGRNVGFLTAADVTLKQR